MKVKEFLFKLRHWENWHHHIKYMPISPAWVWYCIKSGTPWFFTASNPTLTFGGFEGEGKKEMYEQLPKGTYPHSTYINPGIPFKEVEENVTTAGFNYPFIVKPNVGMMGFMFRKINNAEQLKRYHNAMSIEYIVQEHIDYPLEVSAFYYRMPDEKKGVISGFLKKEPPSVIGDGKQSIRELIEQHAGIAFKREELLIKHKPYLDNVLEPGSKYYLSQASNRVQGGKLIGLDEEIDEPLRSFFDSLSHYSGKFYYGRYDIKCESIESLKAGKNFSILEFNGAGAGTQHVYANNYSLFTAMKIILHHWKMMFAISRYNQKNGEKKWNLTEGWHHLKAAKKNLTMLKRLDASFPVF